MRILQLTSDWKWTGCAEPMLLLARAMRERGHEVELACPEAPVEHERSIAGEARAVGFEPALCVDALRGARWLRDQADATRLRAFLDERGIELVHTWHTRDHVLALRAAGARRRRSESRIVRSHPRADRISGAPWNRWLFGPGTDGLLCVSPKSAEWNRHLRGGRPILGCFGAVDLERFASSPSQRQGESLEAERERQRANLGIAPDEPVIGVVARVQRHRRFDLLFDAMSRLAGLHPGARLLVVGRGTHFDEVAREPVRRLGLSDRVVFAGYRHHDYAALLRSIDLMTFLVPGSDGTCRALLEAAACGIPAVVTRRGALPEIVVDGQTGVIVDESPAALAAAWHRLLDEPEVRCRMGEAAEMRAHEHFCPDRLAEDVDAFCRDL